MGSVLIKGTGISPEHLAQASHPDPKFNSKAEPECAGLSDQNKFTFPVLRAFKYGRSNRINAIPDTWFVDTNGNRVFEGVACSKELVEEFIRRVEALRASNRSTATK